MIKKIRINFVCPHRITDNEKTKECDITSIMICAKQNAAARGSRYMKIHLRS